MNTTLQTRQPRLLTICKPTLKFATTSHPATAVLRRTFANSYCPIKLFSFFT